MLYRVHMPMIVHNQTDGCSLSSKDGAVIKECFGQLVVNHLAIPEIAVDDCCCPYSFGNLWSVGVDFIMWCLSIVILTEFSLSLFSCDQIFIYSFNGAVSLGSYPCVPGGKLGIPKGLTNSALISAKAMMTTMLTPKGPFGLGRYKSVVVGSNSYRTWCARSSMYAQVFKW